MAYRKRPFVVILVLVLFVFGKTNAQVVNGGFEEWEEVGEYLKPVGWQNGFFNDQFYQFISRDTQSFSGEYALRIRSSGAFSCYMSMLQRSFINNPAGGNVSLFMHIKSTSGTLSNPNDDIYLEVFGRIYNDGEEVGQYAWLSTEEIVEYTEIKIPIEYASPDSISVNIWSGADGPSGTDVCFD